MEGEPIWDVAHLAHVEMLTPKLDESLKFFVEIMGMSITAEQGDSYYLRAYDDYEHHTLKLTAADQPIELCRRARQAQADAYILVIPQEDKPEHLRAAFEAGADDYLARPVSVSTSRLNCSTIVPLSRARKLA